MLYIGIISHHAACSNVRRFSVIICARKIPCVTGKKTDMRLHTTLSVAVAVALAAAAGGLHAADGDAASGKGKRSLCIGCHGIGGYKTAFPEVYSVPKLGGQHAAYIVKALQAYKSLERSHPSMRAIAATLSDKDMADLAAYYADDATASAAK
jgi:cytochrome c553